MSDANNAGKWFMQHEVSFYGRTEATHYLNDMRRQSDFLFGRVYFDDETERWRMQALFPDYGPVVARRMAPGNSRVFVPESVLNTFFK